MTTLASVRGQSILMLTHVAGMIDLVALPLWIGVLVQRYHYDFERAGMTVTLFLLAAVAASFFIAPRFARLPRRVVCVSGYAVAGAAFLLAARADTPGLMLALHALAGAGVGCGLSLTHGAIGRSANPHRLFALAGAALGLFALLFYAAVPQIISMFGGALLFSIMGGLMLLASFACFFFPDVPVPTPAGQSTATHAISSTTWIAIAGVVCLTINQALIFSFLERIGVTRGFGAERVNLMLAAAGLVNLLPAILAGLLQRRVSALAVALAAPALQAALALTITLSSAFWPFAVAGAMYAFVLIFSHTFLFGLLARIDDSGRAVALTPAMLMAGASVGPALAGFVAQRVGFTGLGMVAAAVALAGTACFMRVAFKVRGARPAAPSDAVASAAAS
ncbi:MFS transporter [Oxalobacteraceae bacterium]|nr:MFS transporter [Oxalobacteraceae bacterium]